MLVADLTTIPRRDTPMSVLSRLGIVEGTSVSIPWLDTRTATVPDISMTSPQIAPLIEWAEWRDKTLEVALRVRYACPILGAKKIAFWGPIHAPKFDYETGTVTINAADPLIHMKKLFVVTGDDLINPGFSLDGHGAQQILAASQNRENQDDLGWPSLGVNPGIDLSTREAALLRKATRGDQLGQTLLDLAQLEVGPDFELEPYETDPVNLASGSVTDNSDQPIPDNDTTDFTLASGLPGIIEGIRVGVYIVHDKPATLDIWLVHPDGTTIVQLYDGTKDRNQSVTGGPCFGTSDANLMFFADSGAPLYGTFFTASVFPKTGQVKAEDKLLSTLYDRVAAGTWKLRIRDRGAGSTGTLKAWSLRFQLPDPAYARLNTWDKPPENPDMDAKFHDGEGPNNASIIVEPMGETTVNWARWAAAEGGIEKIREDSVSRAKIGNWQDWQTTDQADSLDVVRELANREIKAYALPPDAITIKPDDDRNQANLPRLLFNYKVGGHVLGVAKKGNCRHRVPARVTQGVLTNAGGTVRTGLTTIPVVGMTADIGDG